MNPRIASDGSMKPYVRQLAPGLWRCTRDYCADFVRHNGRDPYSWCASNASAAYRGWLWLRVHGEQQRRGNHNVESFPQQVYA